MAKDSGLPRATSRARDGQGQMARDWTSTISALPPERKLVETMICDELGSRNQSRMRRRGGLWFMEDDSMYVYYVPTHWRELE